jgi:hypothetical protein
MSNIASREYLARDILFRSIVLNKDGLLGKKILKQIIAKVKREKMLRKALQAISVRRKNNKNQ